MCCGMCESSLIESVLEWGSERPLECGGTGTKHSCEAEVQWDRGGATDSKTEGKATSVRAAETPSVSVREAVSDLSLWMESEEREVDFISVFDIMNVLVLQVG